jgi:hypothetical protein
VSKIFNEGDLEFDFSNADDCVKFDDSEQRLTHCMSSVDFIFEKNGQVFFVEVKDPGNSQSMQHRDADNFTIDREAPRLVKKARDTFIYRYCQEKNISRIGYFVLVTISGIQRQDLTEFRKKLKQQLPILPDSNIWKKCFIEDCIVFNIDSWNDYLSEYPVRRVNRQ